MEKGILKGNEFAAATDLCTAPAHTDQTLCGSIPLDRAVLHKKSPLDEKISNIFMLIGIPAHTTGYHYLREAIKLAAGNFEMVGSITKKLYPMVAAHFKTSTCKVARGIRNAIEIAWNRGRIININTIFGIDVFGENDKPSNGELIALLAEKIYLDSM